MVTKEDGLGVLRKAGVKVEGAENEMALQVMVVGSANNQGTIKVKKQLDATTSALKVCKATSANTIAVASNADGISSAFGLCVTMQAGSAGEDVDVITFGQINDGFFNFALNAPLYLGDNGDIVDTVEAGKPRTIIGHSLGTGSIFINFEKPIIRR